MRRIQFAQHIVQQDPEIGSVVGTGYILLVVGFCLGPVGPVKFRIVIVLVHLGPGLLEHLPKLFRQVSPEGGSNGNGLCLVVIQGQFVDCTAKEHKHLVSRFGHIKPIGTLGSGDLFRFVLLKRLKYGFPQGSFPFRMVTLEKNRGFFTLLSDVNQRLGAKIGTHLLQPVEEMVHVDVDHFGFCLGFLRRILLGGIFFLFRKEFIELVYPEGFVQLFQRKPVDL